MATIVNRVMLCFTLLCFFSLQRSSAQGCRSLTFSNNRVYSSCNDLPVLSSTLHWNYHPENGTLDIAFRCLQREDGWVAWALNPTFSANTNPMIGAQALFAFRHSNSSYVVYRTAISNTNPNIADGPLSFPVISRAVEYSGGAFTIYARIQLPNNRTSITQAWQSSTQMSGGLPAGHPQTGDNTKSYTTIDFQSGQSTGAAGNSRQHRKNIHGILNAISWGILLPLGVIMARYVKVFADPTWFYLHIACQASGYIIGVAGWGLGLKLGSESVGITYHSHRNLGIALFCLATLQVFALLLRPKPDHKYRRYWNIYHYNVGYAVIVNSVVNIFKGFDILDPVKGWKHAYIAIIATLGGIALILEAITWPIVLKRRKNSSAAEDKSQPAYNGNGVNGVNGHGRQQQYAV